MIAQLETAFDLSQPAGQILAIVLFLIPGLNSTWIIERLAGRSPLSGTERLRPEQPIPGSRGLLLRQEDVHLLEFIELEVDDGEATNN